ncbi:MAG: hypothetical protein ACLFMN_06855, partial [Desulfobacterales bacterium]
FFLNPTALKQPGYNTLNFLKFGARGVGVVCESALSAQAVSREQTSPTARSGKDNKSRFDFFAETITNARLYL